MAHFSERELLVRDKLDGRLVDVSSPFIVLGIYLLESGVLQPDCGSAKGMSTWSGPTEFADEYLRYYRAEEQELGIMTDVS